MNIWCLLTLVTHLTSWIAIVIFVLIATGKILGISLLNLLVRQSFTDTLQHTPSNADNSSHIHKHWQCYVSHLKELVHKQSYFCKRWLITLTLHGILQTVIRKHVCSHTNATRPPQQTDRRYSMWVVYLTASISLRAFQCSFEVSTWATVWTVLFNRLVQMWIFFLLLDISVFKNWANFTAYWYVTTNANKHSKVGF